MTSEYTHNDDVADFVHAMQATWLGERQQMVKRLAEVNASWLASNEELNVAKAEIANLTNNKLAEKEEMVRYLTQYHNDIGRKRDAEMARLKRNITEQLIMKGAGIELLYRLDKEVDKWRKIADDFATAHRKQHGLGGAWDKENVAYDQAVKEAWYPEEEQQ